MKSPVVKVFLLVISFCTLLIGCKKDDTSPLAEQEIINIPIGFPLIDFPDSNTFTKERWELGKRLFYDTQLSKNNTISCASCHHQKFAFGDSVAFSLGDNNSPGTSNAPTLANVAYHPYFTRAGGVSTLEMQILVPIQEHNEFNTNMLDVVDKLKLNNSYNQQAQIAYGRTMDPYVITRAIATFERSLISGNSRYDEFNYAGKSDALNTSEQRGLQLFRSNKANCSQCHSGFNFTNYAFENNGLYLNYADSGRMRLTHLPEDRAKFKVPTLRNIALTGPYMHDGSLATLEDVVEHYNSGGKNHINKSNLITALSLTNQEKQDLVNFLNSLTDPSFIQNNDFKK
jgi:cytochrome c peroxidase